MHQYKRKNYVSYYAEKKEDYSIENQEAWQDKQRNIFKILQEAKPQTVLDLGANTGWFSELAEHLGASVIATDIDEACLDYLYHKSCDQKLNIAPIVLPFEQCGKTEVFERFACDTVMCLALVHHLVFVAGMTLEQIFETLAPLTKKMLIFEYVDLEDAQLQKGLNDPLMLINESYYNRVLEKLNNYAKTNYNLNNFLQIGEIHFKSHQLIKSHPSTRTLVIFHK